MVFRFSIIKFEHKTVNMRYFIIAAFLSIAFFSCGKDKYTSAPQIKFKSITSPYNVNNTNQDFPILIIELTDAEGDFGFTEGKDTSYIYVKNTKAPFKQDSFKFPAALAKAVKKNFKGDIEINLLGDGTGGTSAVPSIPAGKTRDTIYYEIFVKDFAKNKSNVINNSDPFIITQ